MIDFEKTDGVEGWLTLHQASEKMGVSPATLRVWADEGHIPSYRTPGGHRRFRVSEDGTPFRKESRGGGGDTKWRLLEHSVVGRVQLAREASQSRPLPAPALTEQRELERKLIRLCILAIQRENADIEAAAGEMGRALGKWNWRYGISQRVGFEALGAFRRALGESVVEFVFGVGEPNVDELNLWLGRVNEIIDRVSVSMLEYRDEDQKANAGKRKE